MKAKSLKEQPDSVNPLRSNALLSRIPWGDTGQSKCVNCNADLGYWPGSPMDRCDDDKLCGSCTAEKWADETIGRFRRALGLA